MENENINVIDARNSIDVESAKKPAVLYPFGEALQFRSPYERMNEEVFSTIPVLNELANTSVLISNKLSQESRNALFFEDSSTDPELRVLKLEVGMVKRDEMERAIPDMQYLAQERAVPHQSFETADKDEWLKPAN